MKSIGKRTRVFAKFTHLTSKKEELWKLVYKKIIHNFLRPYKREYITNIFIDKEDLPVKETVIVNSESTGDDIRLLINNAHWYVP